MRTRQRALEPVTQYSSLERRMVYDDGRDPGKPNQGSGFYEWAQRQTMIDQVNPGYFKAEREGLLKPVSPMTTTVFRWLVVPSALQASLKWNGVATAHYEYHGVPSNFDAVFDAMASPSVVTPEPDVVLQAALARAQTDAWDTATFLAELGKTVESLATLRGRVVSHYQKVTAAADRIISKRSGKKLAFSYLDAFSEAWLELRYGLRPIYYDMLDIQEAFARLQEGVKNPLARGWETGNPVSAQVSRAGILDTWVTAGGGGFADGATQIEWSALREVEKSVRAAVGVRVTTRETTMFDMAVTAWEVMPWSFILDWFITVGETVAAFSPFATGSREFATYTEVSTQTDSLTFRPLIRPYGVWIGDRQTGSFGSITRIIETRNRVVAGEITPTLAFRLNIDGAKVLDLITIIYSLKSGILKRIALRR